MQKLEYFMVDLNLLQEVNEIIAEFDVNEKQRKENKRKKLDGEVDEIIAEFDVNEKQRKDIKRMKLVEEVDKMCEDYFLEKKKRKQQKEELINLFIKDHF